MDQPSFEPSSGDLSNEEFRGLLHRWHDADDNVAGSVLTGYLRRRIILPKAKRLPRDRRPDAVQNMLIAAFRAGRNCMTKVVDKPRNYVVRAITNAFVDEVRRLKRLSLVELEGTRVSALAEGPLPSDPLYNPPPVQARLLEDEADKAIRKILGDLRKPEGSPTLIKALDAIEVSYVLGISIIESCILLDFGPTETDTVRRSVLRWSTKASSPIAPLIWYLQDKEGSDG